MDPRGTVRERSVPLATAKRVARTLLLTVGLVSTLSRCLPRDEIAITPQRLEASTRTVPVRCPGAPANPQVGSPVAELNWLAACDTVRPRWTSFVLCNDEATQEACDGGTYPERIEVCALPTDVGGFAVRADVVLRVTPGMGTSTTLATPDPAGGCEDVDGNLVYTSVAPPDDFVPGTESDGRLDLELAPPFAPFAGRPPFLYSRVLRGMPRTMAPRILEAKDDGDTEKTWALDVSAFGREGFSPNLRVSTVRVRRGRRASPMLGGNEALVLDGDQRARFVCDEACDSIQISWVKLGDERCWVESGLPATVVDLSEPCNRCRLDDAGVLNCGIGERVEATPAALFTDLSVALPWEVGVRPSHGQAFPTLAEDEVLALELTLESP